MPTTCKIIGCYLTKDIQDDYCASCASLYQSMTVQLDTTQVNTTKATNKHAQHTRETLNSWLESGCI